MGNPIPANGRGRLNITLETVYGHAVKKLVLLQGENVVRFFPKGQG